MFSQKEAVFNAIVSVVGTVDSAVSLTNEQRKDVVNSLVTQFANGEVSFSADAASKYTDTASLKGYIGGLVSNWLRKDTRLNGGEKHKAKNPGSRAGSGDSTVKALRALRSTLTDTAQIAEIEAEIATRVAAKAAAKPKVTIDVTSLPESLRHLVNA